jgi:hypothetical protein
VLFLLLYVGAFWKMEEVCRPTPNEGSPGYTASEFEVMAAALPEQSQLQTVVEALFQANGSDVEDSIVYKQWVHGSHMKIVSMTSTVGEFNEKICRTADQATTHHETAKSKASYLKMLKETILPDTGTVILLDF